MKKSATLTVLVLCFVFFGGCTSVPQTEGDNTSKTVAVAVSVVGQQGALLSEGTVELTKNKANTSAAIALCARNKGFTYSNVGGKADDLFGIPSDDRFRWNIYVDDLPVENSRETSISDGQHVTARYEAVREEEKK